MRIAENLFARGMPFPDVAGLLLFPASVVLEGVVPLSDRLAETDLLGEANEVKPFLRVAGDAVEKSAQQPARSEAHVLGGLVCQQF